MAGDLTTLREPPSFSAFSTWPGPSAHLLLPALLACTGKIIFPEPFKAASVSISDSYKKPRGVRCAVKICISVKLCSSASSAHGMGIVTFQVEAAKALAVDISNRFHGMGASQRPPLLNPMLHIQYSPQTSGSPHPTPQAAAASTQEAKPTRDGGPTCVMDPR